MLFEINTTKEKGAIQIAGFLTVNPGKTYDTQNFPKLEQSKEFKELLRMGFIKSVMREDKKIELTPTKTETETKKEYPRKLKKTKRSVADEPINFDDSDTSGDFTSFIKSE